ncbi:MAG: hypothetical protein AB1420_09885 [Bacillota bacterium]
MAYSSLWEKKRILVTVKAYPQPSHKYSETVCVAGITDEGEWIRLYPVTFRDLPKEKQFSKYDWIEAQVKKASGDYRPESYNINTDTIKIMGSIGTKDNWKKRKEIIIPKLSRSLEELRNKCKEILFFRNN